MSPRLTPEQIKEYNEAGEKMTEETCECTHQKDWHENDEICCRGYCLHKCKKFKAKEEICENCGHSKSTHTWSGFKGKCVVLKCSCKKFKAQNHSPRKKLVIGHREGDAFKEIHSLREITNEVVPHSGDMPSDTTFSESVCSTEGTQNHTRQEINASSGNTSSGVSAEKSLSDGVEQATLNLYNSGVYDERQRWLDKVKRLKKHFELREMETISITPDEIFRVINKIMGDNLI